MRAASGAVDITPHGEVFLEAYDRSAPTSEVVDPIEASVTVLISSDRLMALVSVDNVTIPPWISDRLRRRIAAAVGTQTDLVMLAYTHSHSTPRWDDAYEREVTERLVTTARTAVREASDATIAQAVGWSDAATNSRVARVAMSGEIERAEPIDRRVPITVISDVTGRPVVAIVRYTAHPTVLTGLSNTVSADYPGRVRRIISSQLGCPVVFLQGSCGDIAPGWRGDESALDIMGSAVADAALAAIATAEVAAARVAMGSHTVVLRQQSLPSAEQAEQIATETEANWGVSASNWRRCVDDARAAGNTELPLRLDLQRLTIGGHTFVAAPIETFVSYALEVQEEVGKNVFLNGYANGWYGYLPNEADLPVGGYQVNWAPVAYAWETGVLMPVASGEPARLRAAAVDLASRAV